MSSAMPYSPDGIHENVRLSNIFGEVHLFQLIFALSGMAIV